MKLDLPEDPAMREMRRMIEQQERLLGPESARDALIEASRTPAQRLGLTDSAWDEIQRMVKAQDEVERVQRGGLSESAWEQVKREEKLRQEAELAQRFGLSQSAWDQVQRELELQREAERSNALTVGSLADRGVLDTVIQHTPQVGDALQRSRDEMIVEFTPPPMNTGVNLLKQQIEISQEHLETAKQDRRDAERREQEAKEETRIARRNMRIGIYFGFASLIAAVVAIIYDKVNW